MMFIDAYDNLTQKFNSGNDVPIERTMITKEEWEVIVLYIDELRMLYLGKDYYIPLKDLVV